MNLTLNVKSVSRFTIRVDAAIRVHCPWRSFKMLLYKSGYTGRNFVRGMPKRGTSCKCSLHLPQRARANKESQATFEEQQTLEWKSSAIIILQMKTPEHTHKSGRFQGLIAFILERQSWCLRIVRTKMVFVWNCKIRMLLVFFDNT